MLAWNLEPRAARRGHSCERRPGGRQRLDVLFHVVDARGSSRRARRRRPRRRRSRPPSRWSPAGRRAACPSELLRENPITTGLPSAVSSSRRLTQLEVVLDRLAEADARVEADELLADPGRRPRRRAVPRGTPRPPRRRRRSSARPASSAARPACASGRGRRRVSATTPASSGSPRSAVTSLTELRAQRRARAGRPRPSTVSIESGTRRRAPRAPARPAAAPRRRPRPAEPGRVDSPPTSTIAAPSARSRRALATAAGLEVDAAVGERVGRHVDHAHHRWASGTAARSAGAPHGYFRPMRELRRTPRSGGGDPCARSCANSRAA